MNPLRRLVISSAALAPLGCATATFDRGIPVAAPKKIPSVRSPQLGQEWIYSQFDTFSSRLLDVVTERIEIVGPGVTISRSNRDGANLASEIQSSWGMITTDPHWGRILNYGPAIPLWPEQIQANWSKQFTTRYSIAGYSGNSFGWQQYMYCAGWEKLKVPAGEFTCLRYQNLINFQSDDANKVDCIRHEIIWFAPEIGRWVARESSGSYQIQGQIGAVLLENITAWQLRSWK
ncbi:MAG: hypothetical protein ACO202_04730 [Polynucleobacter sp.]